MNKRNFILWYFSVSILFIILENLNLYLPALAAKSMIIPSLMVYYHRQVTGNYSLLHRLIMAGLFFSWIGDVCLELNIERLNLPLSQDPFFTFGLASFLITHLFYIAAFILPSGRNLIFSKRIYQTLLVVLYGAVILYYLYRNLGDMKIPVIAYTFVILIMLLAALNRYGKVNGLSYILVVIGALLFVLSDSLIAITRYYSKIDFGGIMIMISYVAAQYLIVLGCLKQNLIPAKSMNDD